MYQVKITPLVFDMAVLTVLILRFTVQTLAGLALCFDPTMTLETVIRHQLVVAAVALGAVLHTFERHMHPMQIARRKLGLRRSGNQETDYERD